MTKFILPEPRGHTGSVEEEAGVLKRGPRVSRKGQGVVHGPRAGVFSGAGGAGPLIPGPASRPLAPLGSGLSLGGHPGVPPASCLGAASMDLRLRTLRGCLFFICRGIVASILVFLCFGVTQAKDGPFSRPHPGNLPCCLCVCPPGGSVLSGCSVCAGVRALPCPPCLPPRLSSEGQGCSCSSGSTPWPVLQPSPSCVCPPCLPRGFFPPTRFPRAAQWGRGGLQRGAVP